VASAPMFDIKKLALRTGATVTNPDGTVFNSAKQVVPPEEPKAQAEPRPKKKSKPRRKATKPSEIKPIPQPAPEFDVKAAFGAVNASISKMAPSVAVALQTLESKIDAVDPTIVTASVKAEVASIKDYIQSLKGGYVMEIVRGEDDKIVRVDIDPK